MLSVFRLCRAAKLLGGEPPRFSSLAKVHCVVFALSSSSIWNGRTPLGNSSLWQALGFCTGWSTKLGCRPSKLVDSLARGIHVDPVLQGRRRKRLWSGGNKTKKGSSCLCMGCASGGERAAGSALRKYGGLDRLPFLWRQKENPQQPSRERCPGLSLWTAAQTWSLQHRGCSYCLGAGLGAGWPTRGATAP